MRMTEYETKQRIESLEEKITKLEEAYAEVKARMVEVAKKLVTEIQLNNVHHTFLDRFDKLDEKQYRMREELDEIQMKIDDLEAEREGILYDEYIKGLPR